MAKSMYDDLQVVDIVPTTDIQKTAFGGWNYKGVDLRLGVSSSGFKTTINVENTSYRDVTVLQSNGIAVKLPGNTSSNSTKVTLIETWSFGNDCVIEWGVVKMNHPKEDHAWFDLIAEQIANARDWRTSHEVVFFYEVDVSNLEEFSNGIYIERAGIQLVDTRANSSPVPFRNLVRLRQSPDDDGTFERVSNAVMRSTEYYVEHEKDVGIIWVVLPCGIQRLKATVDPQRVPGVYISTVGERDASWDFINDDILSRPINQTTFIPRTEFDKHNIFLSLAELKRKVNSPSSKSWDKAAIDKFMQQLERHFEANGGKAKDRDLAWVEEKLSDRTFGVSLNQISLLLLHIREIIKNFKGVLNEGKL